MSNAANEFSVNFNKWLALVSHASVVTMNHWWHKPIGHYYQHQPDHHPRRRVDRSILMHRVGFVHSFGLFHTSLFVHFAFETSPYRLYLLPDHSILLEPILLRIWFIDLFAIYRLRSQSQGYLVWGLSGQCLFASGWPVQPLISMSFQWTRITFHKAKTCNKL